MVNNRLLLGLIAFSVSFGIRLLTSGDWGQSVWTGLITLPATYLAAGVVNFLAYQQSESRISLLRHQIRGLQRRRMEEYQTYQTMLEEKERIAVALNGLQHQLRQRQLMGSGYAGALSWDLSTAPGSDRLPPLLTAMPPEPEVEQILSEAAIARQTIETKLNALQADLLQITAQITEQRHYRDQLTQETATIEQHQQQLVAQASALKEEIEHLEQCRVELEQYLSYAEAKKRELETGSNPLQAALKQLQAQVSSLHTELQQLEAQVVQRREEKDQLEQQLAMLRSQPTPVPPTQPIPVPPDPAAPPATPPAAPPASPLAGKMPELPNLGPPSHRPTQASAAGGLPPTASEPTAEPSDLPEVEPPAAASAGISGPTDPTPTEATQPAAQPASPTKSPPSKPSRNLSEAWTDFMVQLPEYEFQALKVITQERDPAGVLKTIADDNLTQPDQLVRSINERALETLGITVIKPGSGSKAPAIAREHAKMVKKLLRTYAYLTD